MSGVRKAAERNVPEHEQHNAESAFWLAAAIAVVIEPERPVLDVSVVRPHAASPWRAGNREPYAPSCELMQTSLHTRAGAAARHYGTGSVRVSPYRWCAATACSSILAPNGSAPAWKVSRDGVTAGSGNWRRHQSLTSP